MPEISYKSLQDHLSASAHAPVWLFYGEEMLCKKAFDAVLDRLLPRSERDMNYEAPDPDNVYEAIEKMNTFSLLSGKKVVALCESRIFYAGKEDRDFLEKAREAWEADNQKKAAKFFSSFLGIRNITFADLEENPQILKTASEQVGDGKWLAALVHYCRDKEIGPSPLPDQQADLQKSIEKGFPPGHYLLITTDMADKRRSLFKCIREKGAVVNCSVPKGSTKADKNAQEAVLQEEMRRVLSESGKNMDSAAYHALCRMTGFHLRTFHNNLEKLLQYTGKRKNITVEDVQAVLQRTRSDPIYELTGALSDRNTEQSLFYLESLLTEGLFPLQIFAAIVNQMRKLLLFKSFTESRPGKIWKPGMNYNQFQSTVLPEMKKYDQQLSEQAENWEELLSPTSESDPKAKQKKNKSAPDLLLAGKSGSPYPLFLSLQKTGRFTKEELTDIMEKLAQTDQHLKSGGQNPKLILERLILHICRKAAS